MEIQPTHAIVVKYGAINAQLNRLLAALMKSN